MDAIKILDNFVDEQTCDYMVEVYKDLESQYHQTGDHRKLISNSKDERILEFLKTYMPKISESLQDTYYVRDLLLSIYETGAYLDVHTDYSDENLFDSLGVLFYLNDDFTGGEIFFSNFEFEYKPRKGSALIFPCNNPLYEHGVNVITSGTRYTMPVEITTKKDLDYYGI